MMHLIIRETPPPGSELNGPIPFEEKIQHTNRYRNNIDTYGVHMMIEIQSYYIVFKSVERKKESKGLEIYLR